MTARPHPARPGRVAGAILLAEIDGRLLLLIASLGPGGDLWLAIVLAEPDQKGLFPAGGGAGSKLSRWMRQTTGSFLGRDPFEGYSRRPDTLHDYVYAASDPVNQHDPSGENLIEYVAIIAIQGIRDTIASVLQARHFQLGQGTPVYINIGTIDGSERWTSDALVAQSFAFATMVWGGPPTPRLNLRPNMYRRIYDARYLNVRSGILGPSLREEWPTFDDLSDAFGLTAGDKPSLVFIDQYWDDWRSELMGGVGRKLGPLGIVADAGGMTISAHELGHIFGLSHIPSYGSLMCDYDRLGSGCLGTDLDGPTEKMYADIAVSVMLWDVP